MNRIHLKMEKEQWKENWEHKKVLDSFVVGEMLWNEYGIFDHLCVHT